MAPKTSQRPKKYQNEDDEIPEEVEEEEKWEWTDEVIDDPSPPKGREKRVIQHTSVRRRGGGRFRVGDIVQLNTDRSYYWIGLIRGFETDYNHKRGQRKRAIVIWFCRQQDLQVKYRLPGATAADIYITDVEDPVSLGCIIKIATVYPSHAELEASRKNKRSNKNPDAESKYVCTAAVHDRSGIFAEVDWDNFYDHSNTDFDGLKRYVNESIEFERRSRRKRKRGDADIKYDGSDQEDTEEPSTPKKRKKTSAASTPKRPPTSALSTPTGRRVKKELQITPLPMKTLPSSLLDSPYKLAQANLHVSAVPTSLPCREEEYTQILEYLENAIEEGTGACIYISGVPGTGKTATVREVVRTLNERVEAEELDDFHFLEINGLKVLDPNQAYAMLWEALTGERVTPLHAASLLDTQFKKAGPGRVPCVVLLDELDQLVMAKQTVLYNLFNWPTLPNSRLIVVAIANTMNLADMLPNKIQSRLTRVNFEPYTTPQLVQIIESRLENVAGNIVESDAIRLCAMRIANNTGDARKALDVCRRAVEIAEASAEYNLPTTPSKRPTKVDSEAGKVTTKLLSSVLQEFLRHPIQLTLRNVPFTSKLFLAALMLRSRRLSGKSDVTFGDVLEEATRICMMSVNNAEAKLVMKGVTTPRGLENAGVELEVCKIIDWEERGGRRGGRVGLQISEDDLNMAFQQDQGWKDMVR